MSKAFRALLIGLLASLSAAAGPEALANPDALPPGSDAPPAYSVEGVRRPSPRDSVSLPEVADVGVWMLNPRRAIADWLGLRHRGKQVLEPINVVIIDLSSPSPALALSRLEAAMASSGFRNRIGHSAGYSALVGGAIRRQLHFRSWRAYSNASFLGVNDHGRVFGPVAIATGTLFTAAFSRESMDSPLPRHILESFTAAREDFAAALESTGRYREAGLIDLGNAAGLSDLLTTFDHDGLARVILRNEDAEELPPSSAGQEIRHGGRPPRGAEPEAL